ncbi:MAG: hypothetical protein AAF558_04120 [Verrucomicrobiota bacterium]
MKNIIRSLCITAALVCSSPIDASESPLINSLQPGEISWQQNVKGSKGLLKKTSDDRLESPKSCPGKYKRILISGDKSGSQATGVWRFSVSIKPLADFSKKSNPAMYVRLFVPEGEDQQMMAVRINLKNDGSIEFIGQETVTCLQQDGSPLIMEKGNVYRCDVEVNFEEGKFVAKVNGVKVGNQEFAIKDTKLPYVGGIQFNTRLCEDYLPFAFLDIKLSSGEASSKGLDYAQGE